VASAILRRARSALAVTTLCVAHGAVANGLDAFLAFNSDAKNVTADFEQTVYDRAGKVVDRSTGRFELARPDKFRWTYEKPHQQLLLSDGRKLSIYDPDLRQVTVRRIDQAIASTPAALLAGKDDITRYFTLRDAGSSEGIDWVDAVPKAADTGFQDVRIGMHGKDLAAMDLRDALGGRTVLRFSRLDTNAKLLPSTFTFTPPQGVEVVDDSQPK
jgi:outer membrane lipoprotein carrier protein